MIKYKSINKVSAINKSTGRVTIPAFIMNDLKINKGDLVEIEYVGNEIIIRKVQENK